MEYNDRCNVCRKKLPTLEMEYRKMVKKRLCDDCLAVEIKKQLCDTCHKNKTSMMILCNCAPRPCFRHGVMWVCEPCYNRYHKPQLNNNNSNSQEPPPPAAPANCDS